MSRASIGWLWVAGQVVVLGAVVVLPRQSDWPTPVWVEVAAGVLFFGGLALIIAAARGLGTALTPTPVPTARGALTTVGLYRLMRHPIYTGVLILVAGLTLRSGNWLHLLCAGAALVFFDRKAAWEEQQLVERFEGYAAYAATTPQFVPRPRR